MSRVNLRTEYLPEKKFLTKYAVDAYNEKYKRNLDYNTCTIRSVESAFGHKYGYPIETMRGDDYVTVMLYFNLGPMDRVDIVRVETIQNIERQGGLGDEVYVVTGEVSNYYKEDGIYKFRWIKGEGADFRTVVFMDDDIFTFMDGDVLSFMNDAPAPPHLF